MADAFIKYFSLVEDGDSAVVRILHTSTSTIELYNTHRIEVNGKQSNVRCPGEWCPLCLDTEKYKKAVESMYVHVYDYRDNEEKMWVRSSNLLEKLKDIEKDWGDLSKIVVKITREGKAFPKYSISVVSSNGYALVSNDLVDKKLAYRYFMTRSAKELEEFVKTGIMPKHEKPASNNNSNNANKPQQQSMSQPVQQQVPQPASTLLDDDDPFADAMLSKRRG